MATAVIDSYREISMAPTTTGVLHAVGRVHSTLTSLRDAPMQGYEGAPDARIEIFAEYVSALDGLSAGADVVLLTWLHEAKRDVLVTYPRDDRRNPLTGVFATRSPDRPNPIGLHRVTVVSIENERWLHVRPLEAIDGTPIVDIKPVLARSGDA
jgi:tRNA-Thr(GGU) m(6)t(6)A37 methyltransferase TsaA